MRVGCLGRHELFLQSVSIHLPEEGEDQQDLEVRLG